MDATLRKSDERYTLALERRLRHSPAKVWRVVTEHELLHQWFPAHVIGEWNVGAKLRFEFQHGEGDGLSEEELSGKVLAVEPERLLEFSWGTHILRCELTPDGDGCRFTLSETLDDASESARNAAGWEMCLQNFEAALDETPPAEFVPAVWTKRFEHYVAAFQPEFGPQEGPPEDHPLMEE